MINSKRAKHPNKHAAASRFKNDSHKTHYRNMQVKPQRGGWRL